MTRQFVIKGIHPASGEVVEMIISAATEIDARARAVEAGLEKVIVTESKTSSAPEGSPLVIVVDDHDETRRLLSKLLRDEGYSAVGVPDGAAALEEVRGRRPALLLTDFNMPGMDGVELLKEVRADEVLKSLPVILFSAGNGAVKDAALAAGANAFISKSSMDWAMLSAEIRRLIGPGLGDRKLPDVPPARQKDAS
jgi:CheY-like chemotaxis protein